MDARNRITFLVLLNVIFFTCISSNNIPCSPATPKKVSAKCPKDTLKFGVCGEWLGLVSEVIGSKPSPKCCSLLKGLADLEAALCLCTAIKTNVLGLVNIKVPVALNLVVNACGKKIPKGFVCE
ncbi:putative lipid-binding protein At4g00165 [Impatiens glandulifera]|uniref:putative lipid-binding protein At4g00165 n=1 Tax=Impatiens glandulifera TaxID=253017 RepID=UPI001FB18E7A|nr:putative lipid-binding protein At4g00165 [Impatiens glandulifera]